MPTIGEIDLFRRSKDSRHLVRSEGQLGDNLYLLALSSWSANQESWIFLNVFGLMAKLEEAANALNFLLNCPWTELPRCLPITQQLYVEFRKSRQSSGGGEGS